MIPALRHWIKQRLRGIGVDIQRLHVASDPGLQLVQAMRHFGIDLVLDVGADRGQFAQGLRANRYRAAFVSFEPLSSAHAALEVTAAKDPAWRVHERVALGASDGSIVINIAGNSASSSVLEMLDLHRDAAPGTGYVGRKDVPLRRLDSIAFSYMESGKRTLLKIDVQGFQRQVFEGAADTIPTVQAILCELSLAPLYKGEELWRETTDSLHREGFILWSVFPGFVNPRDGRSLQMDALFVRE